MSERTFTREDLLGLPASVPRWWGSDGEIHFATKTDLAAFALTLLDRAERAERELAEAEEAIRWECMERDLEGDFDEDGEEVHCLEVRSWIDKHPAVASALARKGEG